MRIGLVLCAALAVLLNSTLMNHASAKETRPNVLVILADDLGYSDLGCYGGEIKTPQLDALASNGLRFTQFYNTARCWPSRAALLTGYYAQQVRRDSLPGLKGGSQGVRPEWAVLLPQRLKPLGYRSYHTGKWHVDGLPVANGFDRSYLLQDQARFFNPKNHLEDDQKLPPIEPNSGYYATVAIADHAIKCLREHAEKHADKPFFQYVAFTAPHFPLQALPEDIDRYREVYQQGWDKLREQRWQRQLKLGLVAGELSKTEVDVGPPYAYPDAIKKLGPGEVTRPLPWTELTAEQRDFQATKMAIHAAMIDRMDREIGRLLDQLRRMQAFDNTLICFVSDNGASAEIMVRDDGHDSAAPMGSAASHLCLGPGWSSVGNTPLRRHKTWVHEGGISSPLVMHWPQGIKAKGELRQTPGHLIDIVPTVLEVAQAPRNPADTTGAAPALEGLSLVPAMAQDGSLKRDHLWWSHEDNRAIRVGDWKLVVSKKNPWELYDLSRDRSESHNLADKHPEKVRELEQLWEKRQTEFIDLANAAAPVPEKAPAKNVRKVKEESSNCGEEPAVPKTPAAKPVKDLILPGESFLIGGRPAFIMWPVEGKRSTPQPWVCYSPTLGGYPDSHEKWMHEQFLAAGVAVAGIDVGEGYGSPQSREHFSALYRELTDKRGFGKKTCLLGRSRGGLWSASWAASNPDKVSGLAGIYPVYDFRTYPGLAKAAPAYGLKPEELEAKITEHNPIDRIGSLAKARVPVFFIHGDQDTVVPLKENSAEFAARYDAAGAKELVTLIVAKGQGHNLWEGFFRCQELIDFTIARAREGAGQQRPQP